MYRTLLAASLSALVALAVAAAGLALWGAAEARQQLRRVELAGAVLQDMLDLKADAYELFRRMSDGIAGTPPLGVAVPDEEVERAALARALDRIRAGIAREQAFLRRRRSGEEEAEELARTAEIERGLMHMLAQYGEAKALARFGRREEGRIRFEAALNELTGAGFRRLFDAAVAEEERETALAQAEARAALARVTLAGQVGGGAAALLAGGFLLVLLRRLRAPLRELEEAARAVAAGDLGRRARLPPGRDDEFARVAASFNAMVEEVARARRAGEGARRALEAAVAARTAELAQANAELRRADALRRRFLADVSHELRTPLTVIRGEAEIALRGAGDRPPAEYKAALARVAEEAALTARLVDDLLFVARAEAGEPRLALRPVDPAELAARVAEEVAPLAREAGLRLRVAPPAAPAGPLVVRGDAGRLRQALLVLVENALRYSPPGGEVEVAVAPSPDAEGLAELTVADRGIGVAPEELPHLFQRFWRGERAAARHPGGSGLGLPLARAIVEAHGGELRLAPRPGGGSVAALTLPLERARKEA